MDSTTAPTAPTAGVVSAPVSAPALIARSELAGLNRLANGPAALRLASHLLLIVLGGVLWAQASLPLLIRLGGLLACGVGLATGFAGLHECSHRTAFRSRWANDAAAWLLGLLSFYNPVFYRRYHQWHHRYTHQPGLDPELEDPQPTTAAAYALELIGWHWWIGKLRGHGQLLWGDLRTLPYLTPELIPRVRRSAWIQCGLYAVLAVLSLGPAHGFLFSHWLLPLALGQPFLRFVLLAEHSGCSFSSDGTRNTRTTLTNAPMRWLMWNMPFHAEHHLYPSLPFHSLPAAHRLLAPHLAHVEAGYLLVHRRLLADLPSLAVPVPAR